MKITDIKVTPSLGAEHRHWSLLKIFTDEGIVGLGEWTAGGPIEQLKQMLIGRDPTNINRLHYDHLWQMQGRGAGVEIALWDIRGKQLNAPMHELLGGKLRDRIRVYCDCHSGAHWTREDYERRWRETRASGQLDPVYETSAYVSMAQEVVAEGYTAIKFDLDVPNPWKLDTYDRSISRRQHHHIVSTIESLRQAIGPYIDLSIDLHGSFNLADALRICKDVEHLDLLWLEDPIRWEWGNVAALAKICQQTETPICTGEIFYGAKMFRELMEQQACDLLEPDIPHSGGAIEIRRIAELAEMYLTGDIAILNDSEDSRFRSSCNTILRPSASICGLLYRSTNYEISKLHRRPMGWGLGRPDLCPAQSSRPRARNRGVAPRHLRRRRAGH